MIYIISNSPGEIFTWVRPICQAINTKNPTTPIHILLTPCQYATGEEHRICQQFPGVLNVSTPSQTLKLILALTPQPSGTVIFLGGDPSYATKLAKKTKSKLIAYTENPLNKHKFDHIVQQSSTYNLMASGLTPYPTEEQSGLVLLPGSRPEHLDVALPFMIKITEYLSQPTPFTVMISPFAPIDTFQKLSNKYPKVLFKQQRSPNDLAPFKYALTIPGSNTLQLAILNIPFLMILPTHNSKILRLTGIIGLCLTIPILGSILKFIIIHIMARSKQSYALPNKLLKKKICPELIGRFSPKSAAETLNELINNKENYHNILKEFKHLHPKENAIKALLDTHI
jgi:hypothetical protein